MSLKIYIIEWLKKYFCGLLIEKMEDYHIFMFALYFAIYKIAYLRELRC